MKASMIRLVVAGAAVLAVGAVLLADPPPDNPRFRVRAKIEDLVNHLNDKDATERAKKIVAEFDSCDISNFFMVQRRGGWGVGGLAKTQNQDSVHYFMNQLNRRKDLTEKELEDSQSDYVRVAKGLQAMALLAPFRGEEFTRGDAKKVQAWTDVSAEFQTRTANFRTAIEERDPKKVRLTAVELNKTCVACHVLRN